MKTPVRQYIAIDLKSFYASVECVERGLDPLDTLLVVADESRTEKTICLAVSPSLKSFGLGGRPRLFEVVQKVREANSRRGRRGKSYLRHELDADSSLAADYLVARPRMAHYISYSTRIYSIYLRYIAPEDIHVYSIDEVFIDATTYLKTYGMSAHELARTMIGDVLKETGITATCGIGTNLYLCKVAMDVMAKKMKPDKDGVRIAELDEMSYRRELWEHEPLTDFWRVGRGISNRLLDYGLRTMGDVARQSLVNEGLLYKLFGVNAELLIDHAWGWEPVTIKEIKAYRPESRSLCSGQVLSCPYTSEKARVVALEMADAVALDLVGKRLRTPKIMLHVGYDAASLTTPAIASQYDGKVALDHYGKRVPAPATGTISPDAPTSSSAVMMKCVGDLFDRIVNPVLLIRRLTVSVLELVSEDIAAQIPVQLELFSDGQDTRRSLEKERRLQETMLRIKSSFGKNAILKGLNYAEGATQKERNGQIGGHHE